jgi:antitoxin component YwqK of YwqJK toxin-antitoxin module
VVETLHPDGQLASRGRLNAKGEKDGVWETWYPSGMLEWRGRYVDGALEGESRKWYETNAPWFVAEMREGRSQHMDVWHVNGCRAMERVWTAGSDAMDEARWWDTGRAMAVGRFIPSRPSGTQCTNRSGLWLEWTEDGSLHLHESGFYRDGIKVRDLAPEEVAEAEVARARLEAALSSAERYFPARPGDPRDR